MKPMRPLIAVLCVSCAATMPPEAPAAVEAAQIIVQPDPITLAAGRSTQLAVQVNDGEGKPIGGAPITFQSSDANVVQVSAHGFVTAPRKIGTASIVVTSGGKSATAAVTVTAGAPARVLHLEGDGQTGQAASALPNHLRVRVVDAHGNPVVQAPIKFHPASGGTVAPPEVRSGDDGTASAIWILGPTAGPQALSAGCGDISTSFQATALPGAAVRIVAVGAPVTAVAAGAVLHVQALVTDASGNPAAGSRVSWTVRGGKGTVQVVGEAADASGLSSANWTLGKRAQRNSLRATLAVAPEISADFVVDAR
jgi:adhesin/invasin